MKHHLGIWPIPLTERPQPLGGGEGVGGTFTGIISLPKVGKSSIFVSSWAGRLAGEWLRAMAEWGKKLGRRKMVRPVNVLVHLSLRSLIESAVNPCIIGFCSQAPKETINGYHHDSKRRNHPQIAG